MTEPRKTGLRVVGLAFLAVAVIKFLGGEGWVVWLILGILFGGLSGLGNKKGPAQS